MRENRNREAHRQSVAIRHVARSGNNMSGVEPAKALISGLKVSASTRMHRDVCHIEAAGRACAQYVLIKAF